MAKAKGVVSVSVKFDDSVKFCHNWKPVVSQNHEHFFLQPSYIASFFAKIWR